MTTAARSLKIGRLTAVELAWAAGLFEGEGTVTIGLRSQNKTYRIQAMVANTDQEVVGFFQQGWGGWLNPCSPQPRRRQAWQWIAAGPTAEQFIRDVYPYIVTERVRKKMDIALEFRSFQRLGGWAEPGYKDRQEALYDKMRELNRRGVPA